MNAEFNNSINSILKFLNNFIILYIYLWLKIIIIFSKQTIIYLIKDPLNKFMLEKT